MAAYCCLIALNSIVQCSEKCISEKNCLWIRVLSSTWQTFPYRVLSSTSLKLAFYVWHILTKTWWRVKAVWPSITDLLNKQRRRLSKYVMHHINSFYQSVMLLLFLPKPNWQTVELGLWHTIVLSITQEMFRASYYVTFKPKAHSCTQLMSEALSPKLYTLPCKDSQQHNLARFG